MLCRSDQVEGGQERKTSAYCVQLPCADQILACLLRHHTISRELQRLLVALVQPASFGTESTIGSRRVALGELEAAQFLPNAGWDLFCCLRGAVHPAHPEYSPPKKRLTVAAVGSSARSGGGEKNISYFWPCTEERGSAGRGGAGAGARRENGGGGGGEDRRGSGGHLKCIGMCACINSTFRRHQNIISTFSRQIRC